ncbi:uncharacterized protein LAESUDRAFT_28651 [Laetiporus sulphureus 93-53]|uniref:BTB domain-containing protein n=1 Tax=Laetiporus sulphureus 93-53 TaxID=1314785 RepID=A0A165IHE4_9APHY|nr:uncharacterized protein LAESUDRAFT_28651 [Laetiporus sulphureus 93-53]KZT13076.1 hypothetical protein LAESUDRAFT_28651 [Laetiporus sulphureus 93-53]
MDSPEWDSVLQFVSDPAEGTSPAPEKRVTERSAVPTTPSQVPTPPDSSKGTPTELVPDLSSVVSVSTTFFPGANLNPIPPDLIFLSSDAVFFYVHSHQVLGASDNGFRGLLPAKPQSHKSNSALKALGLSDDLGPIIPVPEPATVLNVVLHTIYAHSCAHYSPALDTLCAAVDALHRYGVPLSRHCAPGTPLYALLLAHAPIAPIEVYSLAAHYDLYELAVPVSSHMLGFQLATLTDEDAERMGSTYLKRLFFLHLGRIDALKRLLLPPPHLHAPTPGCDFVEQKKLTRAWALASAYLAWDARPDLSTGTMESALCPLGEHLSCDICQKALRERIQQLILQWSVVKRTI